jgi:hypothetical protein
VQNRVEFTLSKGGAAVIRSEYFNSHQDKAITPREWYYFIHGQLERSGHTIGLDGWMARQPKTTAASIQAWLLFGRQGYLHWRLTAYPHFEVAPLTPSTGRMIGRKERDATR